MVAADGSQAPPKQWRLPPSWAERYGPVAADATARAIAAAGGDRTRVTRDAAVAAVRAAVPGGLNPQEDDYVRQVSLAVLQQARGSHVFLEDLDYLETCLSVGRVGPHTAAFTATTYLAPATTHMLAPSAHTLMSASASATAMMQSLSAKPAAATFTAHTTRGPVTLDLLQSTGVAWRVPRGFLQRYNAVSADVVRAAAAAAGAKAGAVDVARGVWGKVTVGQFTDACQAVVQGGLSEEELTYVTALAASQTPGGTGDGFIHDLLFLDKCIQTGRTPSSIRGPELLPTIFLNDTTSVHALAGNASLRRTGGRTF